MGAGRHARCLSLPRDGTRAGPPRGIVGYNGAEWRGSIVATHASYPGKPAVRQPPLELAPLLPPGSVGPGAPTLEPPSSRDGEAWRSFACLSGYWLRSVPASALRGESARLGIGVRARSRRRRTRRLLRGGTQHRVSQGDPARSYGSEALTCGVATVGCARASCRAP